MRYLVKVDTEFNVTRHEMPEELVNYTEKSELYNSLIGNGCDTVERVAPRRLYEEFGYDLLYNMTVNQDNVVVMLVDENFGAKSALELNVIGSFLYETDIHGSPILGNVIFIGEHYTEDGIEFIGLSDDTSNKLMKQLNELVAMM